MSDKVTPWAVLSCPEQSWAVLDHQKYYNSKYWCIADFCHYIPGAVILLILSTRLSGPSLSADCKAPRYIGNWHYPPPHPGENRTAPDYRWGLDLSSRHTPSTLRLRHHNRDDYYDDVWILPADTHHALFVCLCFLRLGKENWGFGWQVSFLYRFSNVVSM